MPDTSPRPKRVLIAENDPVISRNLEHFFRTWAKGLGAPELTITTHRDPDAAIKNIADDLVPFDLVLTGNTFDSSRRTGIEVLKVARSFNASTFCVLMSAGGNTLRPKVEELGGHLIEKPFKLEDLESLFTKAIL